MTYTAASPEQKTDRKKKIKLVVWDLDNTLWDGVLLEDEEVSPRPVAVAAIKTFDEVGILNSIASRNDPERAADKLRKLGLLEYFLVPQINWGAKSQSVERIISELNIGADTVAFIDDDAFERDEVSHSLPQVRTIDSRRIDDIVALEDFTPDVITVESRTRRAMYAAELVRNKAEERSAQPTAEFLSSLGMKFSIFPAGERDLARAEELTVRTNQLNTTGRTYSYDELDALRQSDRHLLLMASLEDKYGPYGTIGLTLVEKEDEAWTIRLLLMSCRIMSRGVGSVLMSYIRNSARESGVSLLADFVPNDRNRMMYAAYKFNGFTEAHRSGATVALTCNLADEARYPDYIQLALPASITICDRQNHENQL